MSEQTRRGFLAEALALHGAVAPRIAFLVVLFGAIAAGVSALALLGEWLFDRRLAMQMGPHEWGGGVLGLLLVMRTNAGYDRWWEARKLWGGFVDRTRNLVIGALSYGPADPTWREQVVRWTAAFPHLARMALRGERTSPDVERLLGAKDAAKLAACDHLPSYAASVLADLLRDACDRLSMDRFAFIQIDHERALLVTNFGGCERISNTPLALVYSIKIRHFIFLYLLSLPLALLHSFESVWLVPAMTMLIAYPLLSLDQMGVELENPFATDNLSYLPLDGICATIERTVLALLRQKQADSP